MDKDQPAAEPDTFPFGRILKSHGLHGELKMKSALHDPDHLTPPFNVTVRLPEGGSMRATVVSMRGSGLSLLIKLEGVKDRDSADALQGARLMVDRSEFSAPENGGYYLGDLVGYKVVSNTGEVVGPVVEAWAMPANDVLKVDYGGREALIPLVEQIVLSIDHETGTVVIEAIEGLLE